jgi:hypothetical protein
MKKTITSFFIAWVFIAQPVLANIKPNDSYYDRQWYLSRIKADEAWEKISSSPDIVVAVIDSGIDIQHPDLRNNLWHNSREIPGNKIDDDHNGFIDDYDGWDFVSNQPDPSPKFDEGWTEAGISHGTMVSGIIAAQGNNKQGVAGVTWNAKIMPLKVVSDKGGGKISDVIRAVDYAANNGADIINLSFMSFTYSEALQEAIRRAHKAGAIIVAAAGNEQGGGDGYDTSKTPIYPACYDGQLIGENMVIGVAATDALDQKSNFSSYGSQCIDITAPGISFFGAIARGGSLSDSELIYDGYWSGTSMAAPLVSATLALIEQVNPELGQRETVNILFASTDDISRLNPQYQGKLGNGRLNVSRAVELAKQSLYNRSGRLLIMPFNGGQATLETSSGEEISVYKNINPDKIQDIVAGDLDDDGREELITSARSGLEPSIDIYNQEGKKIRSFLAFDRNFKGGVRLALLNYDNSPGLEIVAVPASNGPGEARIFDRQGKLKKILRLENDNWRGGLVIGAGDVDGNGRPEIVIAYGQGSQPQVKIIGLDGRLFSSFFPYERSYRGGLEVVVANVDGRKDGKKDEIIVAPRSGHDPLLKIYDNRASLKKSFLAYTKNWQGGFTLRAGDVNNDGSAEIAVGAKPGAAPHVRIFSGSGQIIESFYAWEESFKDGVNLGIIRINNQ